MRARRAGAHGVGAEPWKHPELCARGEQVLEASAPSPANTLRNARAASRRSRSRRQALETPRVMRARRAGDGAAGGRRGAARGARRHGRGRGGRAGGRPVRRGIGYPNRTTTPSAAVQGLVTGKRAWRWVHVGWPVPGRWQLRHRADPVVRLWRTQLAGLLEGRREPQILSARRLSAAYAAAGNTHLSCLRARAGAMLRPACWLTLSGRVLEQVERGLDSKGVTDHVRNLAPAAPARKESDMAPAAGRRGRRRSGSRPRCRWTSRWRPTMRWCPPGA